MLQRLPSEIVPLREVTPGRGGSHETGAPDWADWAGDAGWPGDWGCG